MKKKMILGMLLLFAIGANAQEKRTTTTDTIGTRTVTPTASDVNRANKVEVPPMQGQSEVEAERRAKDKGSNRNQTQVNPEKMPPIVGDTVKKPKPIRN